MRKFLPLFFMLTSLIAGQAFTQSDYPARPIRVVVGFAPGGANDIIARLLSAKLQEAWGQSVVVENRVGASGIIGMDFVAKSRPDGYTLLVMATGMVVNPAMYASLPYDTLRDFEPVTMLCSYPFVLVVNPSVPARSVKELIQLAKSQPNKLNYSSPGSTQQLSAELFRSRAGIDLVHVPYKGSVDAVNALFSNDVQLTFLDPLGAAGPVRSGKLRALAVTSLQRSISMPDLPTMGESGIPDFDVTGWTSLFAPGGTPKPIVDKLHQQAVRTVHLPDIREKIVALGSEPVGNTPEQLREIVKVETNKWISVARTANIKPE